jgi:predicted TPR repeat methyltransferase
VTHLPANFAGAFIMRACLLRLGIAFLFIPVLAGSAQAQMGRVGGVVRDDSGQPVKGATVIADNPNIGPSSFTATTDDKGRFIIIGLRAGQWRFVAQAPGYAGDFGVMNVRFGSPNPPITFTLRKNGPGPNAPLGNITAKDLQAELSAADALFNQQKFDEAVAAYRAIIARTPALTVLHLQIATAYRSQKNYDAAIAAYNTLLKADPENEKAKVGISLTNLEKGDADAAEQTLAAAATTATAGRDVFYNLGEIKLTRGQPDEAARWYERAAGADPSWGTPWYKLGLIALNKGDRDGAASYMAKVLAVDPTSPEASLARTALDQLKK